MTTTSPLAGPTKGQLVMGTLLMVLAIAGIIAFMADLVEFAWASCRDPLTVLPGSASARRARRAAGMHLRRYEDAPAGRSRG